MPSVKQGQKLSLEMGQTEPRESARTKPDAHAADLAEAMAAEEAHRHLLKGLQEALGFSFARLELLNLALTHKSFANEKPGAAIERGSADNERLEFLGDAVLDLAVSEVLMRRFPADPEGSLSKKRASLVNEETLSQIAQELSLSQLIRVGKGEAKTGGIAKPRILASTLEAILGAVQMESGYPAAFATIEKLFHARLEQFAQSNVDYQSDFKTRLQEKVQELYRTTPNYQVLGETGPDHDKQFEVSVLIQNQELGRGLGRSKKAAEQDAARIGLETLAHGNSGDLKALP